MTELEPIAWRAIVYGTPLMSADGKRVGEVREVLGSDAEDIFHGVRIAVAGRKEDVAIPADDITLLSATELRTSLDRAEIDGLPAYAETASFHIGPVGGWRKHLGWKQDSKSDEESG